ncbi:MAG: type II secretion system F family protein [Candidatus Colwellbacteria bacterium]|nr:type II secretion system F family protein [Candidatus Colwellbacteria bacterium]
MARFRYKARTQKGELQIGFVDAATRNEAVNLLGGHKLYVLLLEEIRKGGWYNRTIGYFNRVKTKDLVIFTRQFATLLSAEIALSDALQTLERQTINPSLRAVIREVVTDVDSGLSLSQALEKHDYVFSPFFINLIRSAEITGRVAEAVNYLADYTEKQSVLMSRVRNALMYPAVTILLFMVVVGVMAAKVFPAIGPVFIEAGVELPLFTKILIGVGEIIAGWWWAILLTLILLVFFTLDYLRTTEGRTLRDEILLRLPFFKNLLKELYVARFAESLSVLLKGGIPIAQAIEITGRVIGSAAYRDLLHQMAIDVTRGETLSQSLLKKQDFFPPLVSQMVGIGEATGRLGELLGRISQFYTREVDDIVDNLVELIQPVLMIAIGVFVGLLFASILIPIYSLVQSLRV